MFYVFVMLCHFFWCFFLVLIHRTSTGVYFFQNPTSPHPVLRIHLFSDPAHFFKIYWIFLFKQNFQIFFYFFCIFIFLLFSLNFFNSSDFGFESKIFLQFFLIFCPVDLHIFADPDPGRQNLADPDPKYVLLPHPPWWSVKNKMGKTTFKNINTH